MRKGFPIFILTLTVISLCLLACNKWTDPPPKDANLTNPYCNDPSAVNYNWGFPGRPDDSVCFYPCDLFRGKFIYVDSIALPNGLVVTTQTDTLNIFALTLNKLGVLGFCSAGDTLYISSYTPYQATVDTTLAPLIGTQGQQFCRTVDTVNGTIVRDQVDTNLLHVSFTVVSDTGSTIHSGTAIQQY